MMDLGAMIGGESKDQQLREFGSAYGLLADVATTQCPADILSLVRGERDFCPLRHVCFCAIHLLRNACVCLFSSSTVSGFLALWLWESVILSPSTPYRSLSF